jgi:hypothetical protein
VSIVNMKNLYEEMLTLLIAAVVDL